MRSLRTLATLAAILLAGCVQPSSPAPDCDAAECAAACTDAPCTSTSAPGAGAKGKDPATTDSTLYSFAGVVTGANPPNALGEGPMAPDPVPVAKRDAFNVPEGTVDLSFSSTVGPGAGRGEIFVYDPNGKVVYQSGDANCAGPPGGPAVCATGFAVTTLAQIAAGEYTIDYCVAGAMDVVLEVEASVAVNTTKA